jgi:cytochrome P450
MIRSHDAVEVTPQPLPAARSGWPVVGSMLDFSRDPLGYLAALHQAHGDVAPFSFGVGGLQVLVMHPDVIGEVLQGTGKTFRKGYQSGFATPLVLGNGLVTSEGDFWRRQRKLAQPAFHTKRIASYADTMVQLTAEAVADWQAGTERDIHHEMMRLTSRIATRTLFSAELTDADRMEALLTTMMEGLKGDFLSWEAFLPTAIPTPNRSNLKAAVDAFDQYLLAIIEARRSDPTPHDDLLALLMEARDEQDQPMSAAQLRDEVVTLYIAGHETTANTLTWGWMLLSQNPAVRARLEAEVDSVLGGRPATFADLRQLPYTSAVLKEIMRLYPVAWSISRMANEDVELGGYRIPKDTNVWIAQYLLHRDSRWFDNPLSFDPERWQDGRTENLPKNAYLPFGGGPRICIGNSFAEMEGVLLLATISQRFRLNRVAGQNVDLDPGITIRPRFGMRMLLASR